MFLAGPAALAEPCTITVQPGESIQAAIDAARPGDVICLAAGEREENLVIEKSLTLRAAEIEPEPLSVIRSAREDWPVIRIESEEPIDVTIQGLEIAGAFGDCYQSDPEWICAFGISVYAKATAVIEGNTISDNVFGIWMCDSSQATIEGNTISGSEQEGIRMGASSQAAITGNEIRDNAGCGVVLYERPCIDTDWVFTGYVTGSENTGGGKTMAIAARRPWRSCSPRRAANWTGGRRSSANGVTRAEEVLHWLCQGQSGGFAA